MASGLQAAAQSPASDIGPDTVTVLFEVLSFQTLLDDAGVSIAADMALLALSQHHDLALSEGGRYPGLYRLLAHDNQKLRSMVRMQTKRQFYPDLALTFTPLYSLSDEYCRLPYTI